MGSNSNTELRSRKQSNLDIIAFFDRYYHYVLNISKATLKKQKMAITYKLLLHVGEIFVGLLTGGMIWQFGLTDIKTLIGIFFIAAFGIIRLLIGWVAYQNKKQDFRERMYKFNRQIEQDKQEQLQKIKS